MKHVHRLWGFPVRLEAMSDDQVVEVRSCPEVKKEPEEPSRIIVP
jgi:spore cortex formation protein SpoVR/YcgB (stage V sporulation)